jgi:hypothetical protein
MVESVYIFSGIAISCQVIFVVVLARNMIIRKSLVGWLFPGGTTKLERILLLGSIAILLLVMIGAP